ncbi:Nitrogen assimilation transcription factor [Penicillium ucsense]|uniref:Nitrogen assimilation transcription factor n=1 Tax=Penicillium ucsense TaxID=2839758 RepID=A0A8J8WAL3_9EURO|nr:Nitrogen assimilation transcription factor [Penicillium ucsense]KAF7736491.1 Nitrogen assimilation transcription factor [Penicillium ucsense]
MVQNTPRRGRRAAKACTFCRRRKASQRVTTESDAKPTKARLARLEVENEQLRRQLGAAETHSPDTSRTPECRQGSLRLESQELLSTTPSGPPCDSGQPEARTVEHSQSAVSRIFISPNGDSSYHGLTSTLFDDAPTDRRGHGRPADQRSPADHVSKRLMGEAAYQRQLEALNFRHGKLDFDGVDPELGMHLLSLHWNRQHHSFLITYRPAFMRDMACGGPYFSKLLLNAIYFGASKFSTRPEVRRNPNDVRTAGWTFRMRVKELLGSALDRSEITTIQALLVMTSSLFALGDERSAAWLYAGTAFRMIIDLGMHVDATMLSNMRRLSDEDLEIRRRVFWGAFVVDKIQSLYQGRPASLQDFDTKVSIVFLDDFEELEEWQPFAYSEIASYPGSPAYSVSTFTELCKLSLILNGILNKVYSERSSTRSTTEHLDTLESLDQQLKTWHEAVPDHLRFNPSTSQIPPPPHVISLLALYNVLLILLHRPFVAEGHLHTTDLSVAITSFSTCTVAANRIIQLLQAYDQTYSIRRAPYLISYATYVAATIFVRVAAQKEGGSRAHASLRTCLNIFKKNQETNWAVRRAENVILHLMSRMEVSLDSRDIGDDGRGSSNSSKKAVVQNQAPYSSGYGSNTNARPTTDYGTPASAELDEPELDIDMIIQSFIRQDNRLGDGQSHLDNPDNQHMGSDPLTSGTQNNPTSSMMPSYGDIYAGPRIEDDMLFGFNGSIQDTLMY